MRDPQPEKAICEAVTLVRMRLLARDRSRFFWLNWASKQVCIGNKHFFSKSCHRQTYKNYEQPPQRLQNLYFQSHISASKFKGIFLNFIL